MKLFQNFKKFKNQTALINDDGKKFSYGKIIDYSKKISKTVKPRSLVLLITENSISSIVSYISLIKNDCVVIILDVKTPTNNVLELFEKYKPNFVFFPKNWIDSKRFKDCAHSIKFLNYRVISNKKANRCKIYTQLSLLLTTSGSMGSAKLVRLSKKNLFENARSIKDYLKINNKKRSITTMPTSYSFMISIINSYIENGASIYVTRLSILQKKFWENFKLYKITSFSGVPYIFETIMKLGLKKVFTDCLEEFTQAGGKLNKICLKNYIKLCEQYKKKFIVMYGQTEASPRMSFLEWKFAKKKIGSIGRSLPRTKFWIIDQKNKKVKKSGITGELIFKGLNVALGYSKNISDLEKGDENKGILKTGDLANMDNDGFIYLKGRINRIAKVYGNRINLDELEEKMLEHQLNVVCKNNGDKIQIFYEKDYSQINLLEKLSILSALNKTIFEFKKLNKFPKTPSGKINIQKLKV
jgi:long-chain acyl-CoA synthetase